MINFQLKIIKRKNWKSIGLKLPVEVFLRVVEMK
jgi:hypothetical protein